MSLGGDGGGVNPLGSWRRSLSGLVLQVDSGDGVDQLFVVGWGQSAAGGVTPAGVAGSAGVVDSELVVLEPLGAAGGGGLPGFPHRFHEPYYRHYAMDDLDGMFSAAGLALREQSLPFLSKLMVRVKE